MIDITMTATKRPELIEKTLSSFKKNLFKDADCRLIVNVDPVGSDDVTQTDVVALCHKFFPVVTARCPHTPDFASAFKWTWMEAKAKFVFHLEDDWELIREVSLQDMISLMEKDTKLATLRLPRWRTDKDRCKNWGHWFPWNGKYFECPEERVAQLGVSGHPSLFRGSFVMQCSPLLRVESNPEKQFHYNREIVKILLGYGKCGVFAERDQEKASVVDIGKYWKVNNGWRKAGSKAFFTSWCREGEE